MPAPPTAVERTFPDEAQLRQLQRLSFSPDTLTMTGLTGEHRSRRKGPSPEFADFKPYTPGDDFRRIDWNTYARLDQLFIRESETTTERDIHLFVDLSASMDWASSNSVPAKLKHAASIASLLGYVAIWHFDRCAIQGFGGTPASFGPAQGRSNVLRMFNFCQDLAPGASSPGHDAIERNIRLRKRPGRMIVISDFLWANSGELRQTLQLAASRRWQTTLILVQDPAEADPSLLFDEAVNLELRDLESAESMHVGADRRSLDDYTAARASWLNGLQQQTSLPGATWLTSDTSDSTKATLLRGLVERKVLQR